VEAISMYRTNLKDQITAPANLDQKYVKIKETK
jgi:hypothetical protein